MTAAGTLNFAPGQAELWTVNVNTGVAASVLKIYNNVTAVAADLVASIDASAPGSFCYGVSCPKGITAVMSGANSDVTIGYK